MSVKLLVLITMTAAGVGTVLALNPVDARSSGGGPNTPPSVGVVPPRPSATSAASQLPPASRTETLPQDVRESMDSSDVNRPHADLRGVGGRHDRPRYVPPSDVRDADTEGRDLPSGLDDDWDDGSGWHGDWDDHIRHSPHSEPRSESTAGARTGDSR